MQKSTGLGDVQYFFVIYTISNAIDIFNSKKSKKWRGEHREKREHPKVCVNLQTDVR